MHVGGGRASRPLTIDLGEQPHQLLQIMIRRGIVIRSGDKQSYRKAHRDCCGVWPVWNVMQLYCQALLGSFCLLLHYNRIVSQDLVANLTTSVCILCSRVASPASPSSAPRPLRVKREKRCGSLAIPAHLLSCPLFLVVVHHVVVVLLI